MSKQDTYSQDVRKEQIALLRFEKQLVAMAETLAAGSLTASSTDEKLQTREASVAYKRMKKALQNLADETGRAHENLMNRAVKSDGRFIEFGNEDKSVLSAPKLGVQIGKRDIGNEVKSVLSVPKPGVQIGKRDIGNEVKSVLSVPKPGVQIGKRDIGNEVKSVLSVPKPGVQIGKRDIGNEVKSTLSES